jgi:3,2-trans-enoyl-CoA isomerase
VAAIRGACPAGGCAIALCCDARLMTGGGGGGGGKGGAPGGFIGLNEVALGISVPKYWAGVMAAVIGAAPAERLLLSGSMVGPEAALKLGLVDELVGGSGAADAASRLLARAQEVVSRMVALPAGARAATKRHLRGDYAAAWLQYALTQEAGPQGYAQIEAPATVAAMGAALARLSGGGGGKKAAGGGGGSPRSNM